MCDLTLECNGISAVDLTPSTDKVMNLFGSEPQFILQVSSQAIEFWCFQKELELTQARKATDDLQTQLQQMEKSYKEKLFEQQRNVEFLHRQIDQLRTEHDKQQKELTELKEKYAQKSRQKRKLEELYQSLKTNILNGGSNLLQSPPASRPVLVSGPISNFRTHLYSVSDPKTSLTSHSLQPTQPSASSQIGTEYRTTQQNSTSSTVPVDRFSLLRQNRLTKAVNTESALNSISLTSPNHSSCLSSSPSKNPMSFMTKNINQHPSDKFLFNFAPNVPFSHIHRPETPFLTKRRNTLSFLSNGNYSQDAQTTTLQSSQLSNAVRSSI